MNSYLKIAIVIVTFAVGFFLGRKTIDGNKALVHAKFASALVDLNNENVLTLDVDSEEFRQLILEEFTEQIGEEE